VPDTNYGYDCNGRLSYVSDASGSRNYSYDTLGEPQSETTSYTGLAHSLTTSYQYNPDGTLQQLTTQAGTYQYRYNSNEELVGLTNPGGHSSAWSYDNAERITRQLLGNKSWTSYRYDSLSRLTDQCNYGLRGRVLDEYKPSYGQWGNITNLVATVPGMPTQQGNASYGYNSSSGALTNSNWNGASTSSQSTSFDTLGNLLTGPGEVTGYQGQTRHYDSNNQWDGYDGQAIPTLFAYDDNGNPTTYKGDTLAYNVGSQLTSYTHNTATLLTAGYRGDGLRAWKAGANDQKTFFYYVGDTLLAEVNAAGMVTSYNTYGPTGLL